MLARRRAGSTGGRRAALPADTQRGRAGTGAGLARWAGDAGFLCRLVRFVQGDGAVHVLHAAGGGADEGCAAAAGGRNRQQRGRPRADEEIRAVRPARHHPVQAGQGGAGEPGDRVHGD